MPWDTTFLALFNRALAQYQGGNTDFQSYYSDEDLAFLKSIGYKPRELFDFVEDLADEGAPSESCALLIAAVRRDYFRVVQNQTHSDREVSTAELPTFGDKLGEFPYLPRIIVKARAKLAGELDPDVMFGCGGDRNFFTKHGDIHPADFLRHVWAAGDNDQQILAFVRTCQAGSH